MSSREKWAASLIAIAFLSCGALLIGANFAVPTAQESILTLATDGFKLALGAVIATASLLLGERK